MNNSSDRRKVNNKKKILFFVFVLVIIGIAYAALSATFNINGTANINKNSWRLYFDTINVKTGSVTDTNVTKEATIVSNEPPTVEFAVKLNEPGDYYEFTVEMKNDGSIDAMIDSINMTELSAEESNFFQYDITYANDVMLKKNDILRAGGKEILKVRFSFRKNIEKEELNSMTDNVTKTLQCSISYVQAVDKVATTPSDPSFETLSWSGIADRVNSNDLSLFSLDNQRDVYMGKTYKTHKVRIANLETPSECSNKDFSQTACGFVLEFVDIIDKHEINPAGTYEGNYYSAGYVVGGYPASSMYQYLNSTIYNAIPNDLKNVMIRTKVVSSYGIKDNNKNFVTYDKLYLLTPKEVLGDGSYSDSTKDFTRQLDYYFINGVSTSLYANNSAIKKYNNVATPWWTRSVESSGFIPQKRINDFGNLEAESPKNPWGVSPAFKIG